MCKVIKGYVYTSIRADQLSGLLQSGSFCVLKEGWHFVSALLSVNLRSTKPRWSYAPTASGPFSPVLLPLALAAPGMRCARSARREALPATVPTEGAQGWDSERQELCKINLGQNKTFPFDLNQSKYFILIFLKGGNKRRKTVKKAQLATTTVIGCAKPAEKSRVQGGGYSCELAWRVIFFTA